MKGASYPRRASSHLTSAPRLTSLRPPYTQASLSARTEAVPAADTAAWNARLEFRVDPAMLEARPPPCLARTSTFRVLANHPGGNPGANLD
jgi:hypothetical protein